MICTRCKFDMEDNEHCGNCGKHKDRVVRKTKRRRPIGGKRGRNSGTVGTAKNK